MCCQVYMRRAHSVKGLEFNPNNSLWGWGLGDESTSTTTTTTKLTNKQQQQQKYNECVAENKCVGHILPKV